MKRFRKSVIVSLMMVALMISSFTPVFDGVSGVATTSEALSVRYTKNQARRKLEKWWRRRHRDYLSDSSNGFFCEFTKKNSDGYYFALYTFHLNSNNEMTGVVFENDYYVDKYYGRIY